MVNNPSPHQKKLAYSSEIAEQLNNLTLELDERVKKIKVLAQELIKEVENEKN